MRGLGETGECGSETRVTDRGGTGQSLHVYGIRVRARSRMILTFTPLVIVVYVPYVMHATLQ